MLLRKFHMVEGQNVHDQIMGDKRKLSHYMSCMGNTSIMATWRLGLWAPLVARKFRVSTLGERVFGQKCHVNSGLYFKKSFPI